jgi:hypothetical protein
MGAGIFYYFEQVPAIRRHEWDVDDYVDVAPEKMRQRSDPDEL